MGLIVVKELFNNLKFAWSYAKGQKKYLILLNITNIFSIAFSIIAPILSAKIIVSLTSNEYTQIMLIDVLILYIAIHYQL